MLNGTLDLLKREVDAVLPNPVWIAELLRAMGYTRHLDAPNAVARAEGIAALLTGHDKYVYPHDLIAGSIRGILGDAETVPPAELAYAAELCQSYGRNGFHTNNDHYAPDYEGLLRDGVGGTLRRIETSREAHRDDPDASKHDFLRAARIALTAFSTMIAQYGDRAAAMAREAGDDARRSQLSEVARICHKISSDKPDTFREALQLVWLCHVAFVCEGRYAMALGRLDQYLYPFYRSDLERGALTDEDAVELLCCMMYKIGERRLFGGDDVVNIAVAGRRPDGTGGVNPLSTLLVEAVKRCNIPGPNLSARLYEGIDDAFIDACLVSIGTGLGYPALMNDEVNIPALARWGYAPEVSHVFAF